jgi:hypothetical protein
MKKANYLNILGVIILLLAGTANSVNAQNSSSHDKRLLNDYTSEQLDEIRVQDPEMYTALNYYYTQSYVLEIVECQECTPVDPATFNIGQWEILRQREDYRIWTNYKRGFKITLIPISKMEYKLPVHLAKLEYNIGE